MPTVRAFVFVLFCCVLVQIELSIYYTLLGQWYDCPSVNEVTLKNMVGSHDYLQNSNINTTKQSATKRSAYLMGYTLKRMRSIFSCDQAAL